ncbi:MAG: glycosyltransferase [Bacteroidia bacterium]|jgi:glycosyltransferase involved in cell wall biosynthesis
MHNIATSEVLILSSYPPRECGIATYTQDLVNALKSKFSASFNVRICALENETEQHNYPKEVKYKLKTHEPASYRQLSNQINADTELTMVLIQHEFGFYLRHEEDLLKFIHQVQLPVAITFHTVLPNPEPGLKLHVQELVDAVSEVIVMTHSAAKILNETYAVDLGKINIVAHGTHLVDYCNKEELKQSLGLDGRTILSTFGLISSGKSIETTLKALPKIVQHYPDVLFLVIGKTHPSVVKQEGEVYREKLKALVIELQLDEHVRFINYYSPLPELLQYLQLTDIYLFTSKDPNQAVSGTFSYAIGCGCPIVSTPIPHAVEVLGKDAGVFIDFENHEQLSTTVNKLLAEKDRQKEISNQGLHRIASTAWENIATAHALLIEEMTDDSCLLKYNLPAINLNHIQRMTTDIGIIQFSKFNQPDIESGFTLDDNARALISMCMHYALTRNNDDLDAIHTYLTFIERCSTADGRFTNYTGRYGEVSLQNQVCNLDDSNGRAVWALGYLVSHKSILPSDYVVRAMRLVLPSLAYIQSVHSTRSIAFALKGIWYLYQAAPLLEYEALTENLANKLERMYLHESEPEWNWFESYLTYGNSILPEAMLCAYQITRKYSYKAIARVSFDFLLDHTFTRKGIKLISNKTWLHKGITPDKFGEQPIDVCYTILALSRFYDAFEDDDYRIKMNLAFDWFQGRNHLGQIVYNPRTGGCYDGLEEHHMNLNQGAESTLSYLLSRLTVEKYKNISLPEEQHLFLRLQTSP